MADDSAMAFGNERQDIGAAQKLTHQRNEIFIREYIAIEPFDRGGVARNGLSVHYLHCLQSRTPLQNRFSRRSM